MVPASELHTVGTLNKLQRDFRCYMEIPYKGLNTILKKNVLGIFLLLLGSEKKV